MDNGAGFILIIEDDVNLANLLRELLHQEGYHSKIAFCCAEAAQILAEPPAPYLILMDYLLSDATCEELLDADGTVNGVQVILITAMTRAVQIAARLNVRALVEKPFDLEFLTDLVRALSPVGACKP